LKTSQAIMAITTIDEVIAQLDDIIATARSEKSRLGFFAALYRNVTIKVKEGIQQGLFEDGPRMERLDVTFASRYLSALNSFRAGQQPSKCWLVAFEAANTWRPIILQHLLLGMNAHINFDLGIAAAQIAPGDQLPGLEHDFNQINSILAGMVQRVRANVDQLSPWINLLDHIDPKADTAIINFSLGKARANAWSVATELAPLTEAQLSIQLEVMDTSVWALGQLIWQPLGFLFKQGLLVIRLRESSDVPLIIDVLGQMAEAQGQGSP
jgi:hypothetical protein